MRAGVNLPTKSQTVPRGIERTLGSVARLVLGYAHFAARTVQSKFITSTARNGIPTRRISFGVAVDATRLSASRQNAPGLDGVHANSIPIRMAHRLSRSG